LIGGSYAGGIGACRSRHGDRKGRQASFLLSGDINSPRCGRNATCNNSPSNAITHELPVATPRLFTCENFSRSRVSITRWRCGRGSDKLRAVGPMFGPKKDDPARWYSQGRVCLDAVRRQGSGSSNRTRFLSKGSVAAHGPPGNPPRTFLERRSPSPMMEDSPWSA
jgi:hypothetical protein